MAAPSSTRSPATDLPPTRWGRLWRRPLGVHVLALTALLLVGFLLVRPDVPFSADEGAALRQATMLADGEGWTSPHPFPEVDPEGVAFPLSLSHRAGDEFSPFAKHPTYAVVLSGLDRVAGPLAMPLLSVAGTILAALAGALVARRIDDRLTRPTLWLLGLASPLLFDGYLVIAHTLGAALATAALLVVLDARKGTLGPLRLLGLAAAVAVAALLRNEAVIYGVALGVVALAVAVRHRSRPLGTAGLVAAGTAVLTYRLEPTLVDWALDGRAVTEAFSVASRGNPLAERAQGLAVTWLLPSYGNFDLADITLAAMVLAVVATAVAARTKPEDAAGIRLFAAVAALAAVARLVVGDAVVVPGLLMAFPLLPAGMVLLRRSDLRHDVIGPCVAVFAVFALGVIATQYADGGSGEWGGRYFALGLPTIVPVVVFTLTRAGQRLDRDTRRWVLGAAAVMCLALSVLALTSLREGRSRTATLVTAAVAEAEAVPSADGGLPVIVTTHNAVGRWAWEHQDEARWLRVADEPLEPFVRRLGDLGVGQFVVVGRGELDRADLPSGTTVVSEREPLAGQDWVLTVVATG